MSERSPNSTTFLDRTLSGQGQVCFVTGEAGAGKTALVGEFARWAQEAHSELVVAIGNCNAQTGIGDPYLPFREVLALLTGDVDSKLSHGAISPENAGRLQEFLHVSGQTLVEYGPDLIDIFVPGAALASRVGAKLAQRSGWMDRLEEIASQTDAGRSASDQNRIFEQYTAVLQALAAQQPLMMVLDDLQWTDASSVELLFHLGRRIDESQVLLVGTYRSEEVSLARGTERHPLERVVNELKRHFGDVWVSVEPAEEEVGRQFVDALLDGEPNRLAACRRSHFCHENDLICLLLGPKPGSCALF